MQFIKQEKEYWVPLNFTLETFMRKLQQDYKNCNTESQLSILPENI